MLMLHNSMEGYIPDSEGTLTFAPYFHQNIHVRVSH